jgi:RecB family exonuclease
MINARLNLTSTGRLARKLRHRFRIECTQKGMQGWKSLNAIKLEDWLTRIWFESWPEKIPASELYRINLWRELAERIPPPVPLDKDFNLYRLLDANYDTMIRCKINPGSGPLSTLLVEWRRTISRAFKKSLDGKDFFHPSELPSYVGKAIADNIIICPDRISFLGFESLAPIEEEFFKLLEDMADAEYGGNSGKRPGNLEAITLPSPEQEVIYLAHRLIEDAKSIPLHRIGVVVPDLSAYSIMIERSLKELMGESSPAGTSWFNITLGIPLINSMLVKAALIPLRFMTEGQTRELFLSLLLSPYYGCWQGKRHVIARADITWRTRFVESGLDNLLGSLERDDPDILGKILSKEGEALLKFAGINFSRRQTASYWINAVEKLWSSLGFPVISEEKDTVDSKHLSEVIHDMSCSLGHVAMDGYEFYSFLTHSTTGKMAQIRGSEEAGIQILGLIESRGLDFDKLYVLGLDDRALPQPVRPMPLLDTYERKLVHRGTPASAHEIGLKAFSNLISCAPDVTLTRAEQKDSKPLSPSPFWPKNESEKYLNIWTDPGYAWIRAPWLRSAYEGLQIAASGDDRKIAGIKKSEDTLLKETALSEGISATGMKTAITCPFRFLIDVILKIKPLEEKRSVVSPMERGLRIHRIVASFTSAVREKRLHLERDRKKVLSLLTECVDQVLKDVDKLSQWEVERRLLLFEDSPPGMLISWLDAETGHRREGWECIAEELDFIGLKCDGWSLPIKGRIDRIDYHKDKGLICWDYKTGSYPNQRDILERLIAPQLPVYLLALRMGNVSVVDEYLKKNTPLSAGYAQLKNPAAVKMYQIKGIEEALDKWIMTIADMEEILERGDFRANPYPVSNIENKSKACEKCSCITLCERGIVAKETENDS